jgi:long-chain fatty acid transport protein
MPKKAFPVAFPAFVALLAIAPTMAAQDLPAPEAPTVGPPPVQFNFAPPGARSLAMGASFIGLADDATAAESNPAGLTILTKPEFSAHLRYTEFENTVPNTVSGVGFETFTNRVGSPSFLSVVYPWQKAAVSLFYQRAADFRSNSRFEGFIANDLYNEDRVDVAFRTENFGLSGAFKVGSKVSVGASIRATRVKTEDLQRVTLVFPFIFDRQLMEGQIVNDARVDGSKVKATFNAGVLITPTPRFSLGAVFKQGADLDFTQTAQETVDAAILDQPLRSAVASAPVRITVPDVFGGGVAIKATDTFTILFDVVRIKYSQADLGEDHQNGYQRFGEGGREPLEDGTEFHGGLEYTWARGNDWIFSVRGGYFLDPDHDGLASLDSKQNHVTFGGGVVVKNKLQVDGAVNIADAIKEGLISFVVRF